MMDAQHRQALIEGGKSYRERVARGEAKSVHQIRVENAEARLHEAEHLQEDIDVLRNKHSYLKKHDVFQMISVGLTNKTLLSEAEIVAAGGMKPSLVGVYFLIRNDKIVYVGQSVNVFARVYAHPNDNYDSVAWIPCDKSILDKLESLYIHYFRPELNGTLDGGKRKHAPFTLEELLNA